MKRLWTTLRHILSLILSTLLRLRWHQFGRAVAAGVLLDQWLGPLGSIPSSEAIVVVALGAIFAPVPSSRDKEK